MKKAEEYIEEYYHKNFETDEWVGLEEYSIRFKAMYLKEAVFLREIEKDKSEKEIAFSSIKIVNESYNKTITRFSALINEL